MNEAEARWNKVEAEAEASCSEAEAEAKARFSGLKAVALTEENHTISERQKDIVNRKSNLKTADTPLGGGVILCTMIH